MSHPRPVRVAASILLVLVPLGFGAAAWAFGVEPQWAALGLGAAGWIVALLGRAPLALALRSRRGDAHRVQRITAGASGVLEEPVRLGALLILGFDLRNALYLGVGWAFIEAVYAVVNVFARSALAGRTDEEAEQAKQVLEDLGMGEALDAASPWWGVLERLSATGLHLAFGLFYVAEPWLVVVGVPVHSAANLGLTESLRRHRSLAALELTLFAIAAVLLIAGLAVASR